jgi:hypothetical protein
MIIFLEKEKKLYCKSEEKLQTILFSISQFRYFYKKILVINNKEFLFNGISLKYYEKNKEYSSKKVEVYIRISIKEIEIPKIKEQRLTPQRCLDFFMMEYEKKFSISYILNNKILYLRKFRKLMDEFYKNDLKDLHLQNYIKRCVKFGNHKGEPIYLDFLFNDKVLQNYFLFVKGIKDIDSVWPHLDTTLSKLEKKKIKYLMNLKLFDTFKQVEKILCFKLYKKYNYKKLSEKYNFYNNVNVNVKKELFKILKKDYNMGIKELMVKTKHTKIYFSYEYTKKQIKEALEK